MRTKRIHAVSRKHLLEAMRGEAFAFVSYMLYAKDARAQGFHDVAKLFEQTALIERYEHFVEMAALYGLSTSTAENLERAIAGEEREAQDLYARFAKETRDAGDIEVANRFEELKADEARHKVNFESALSQLSPSLEAVSRGEMIVKP